MFLFFLFAFIVYIYKSAFSVYFFSDDFFFLKISRINSFQQFIYFFNPIRQYSYKPVATEVYYFLIHQLNYNIFLSHLIVFIFFFIGLYYLYKIIFLLTSNKPLSYLTTSFYAVNNIHVFQLYFFGTFQEVAVFTFLTISLYKLLFEKNIQAIVFFILALLSKETAILYIPFLIIFKIFFKKKIRWNKIYPYVILGLIFYFLYQYSLKYVTSLDNYKIQFNPRLIANNFMWYFLWSLGLPNFMPIYLTSVFKPPIPEFYVLLKNIPETKTYFLLLLSYYSLFITALVYFFVKHVNKLKQSLYLFILLFIYFFIFLGPIGFFQHKWMVRLTMPLVFIILIQTYFIDSFIKSGKLFKVLGCILIILYLIINIKGVPIFESSSVFLQESKFTTSAKKYFEKNKSEILKHSYIYFIDPPKNKSNPWGGSEKLKVTLGDQSFIDLYFPGKNIKAIYGFENNIQPKNSFTVKSIDILTAQ